MLSVRNLVKTYKTKKADTVVALNNVSIDFPETGLVFLLGKSGSGKSTLLNAIGGLDTFDSGEIIIKGKSSKDFSQSDFDSYRNTFIGFIFQEYNILENFSVYKNLALALELQGKHPDKTEINRLLEQVEMTQYAKRKPNQLSGGQKQRVAIARALVKNPEIIMADEPTGALDSNTGKQVMDTLKELSKTKLVIIVSHDREFAEIYGDRMIELKDGKILHDVTKKEIEAQETASGIKIIDDSIVYIKKGQEVSERDMKAIVKIITDNSQKSDTFISFDKAANNKLKEGAKINDDGNKEAFLKTEAEDIKQKQYNPNSLKLIKSRLKFADSFKMGASALKNKVGKLIFTILLSFVAFTVFGIVDAFSCWNRADSVYQAIEMTNQKNIVMMKTEQRDGWSSQTSTLATDLAALQKEFPNHKIKGAVSSNSGSSIRVVKSEEDHSEISLKETNNPLKTYDVAGYVYYTKPELESMGFSIKGRLPDNDKEVAISRFLFNNLITASKDVTEGKVTEEMSENGTLWIRLYEYNGSGEYSYVKVVGVVDDKTDWSKYEQMEEDELVQNQWQYREVFNCSFAKLTYVCESQYNKLVENGGNFEYVLELPNDVGRIWTNGLEYYKTIGRLKEEARDNYIRNNSSGWWNYSANRLYTQEELLARYKDQNEDGKIDNNDIKNDYGYPMLESIGGGNYSVDPFPVYDESTFDLSEYVDFYNGDMATLLADGLADNQILVSKDSLDDYYDDYQAKIKEGLVVSFVSNNNSDKVIKEFTIVGTLKNYGNILTSTKTFDEFVKPSYTGYSFLLATLTGDKEADKAFINRCEIFDDSGIRFTIQNSATGMLEMLEDILDMMTNVFFYIAIGFAVFASLMLMNFISTSISYKKREIGVLRALGARGSDIFGIFFNESMVIAMINFVLAAIATVVGCYFINSAVLSGMNMEIVLLNVGIRQVVLILAISVAAAFLASFLPTFKISRKKPIDAINNR